MKEKDFSEIINYAMVDLHLHFDGAISANIIEELMKLQPKEKIQNSEKFKNWDSYTDEEKHEKLSVTQDCGSLDEYLEKFDYPIELLQTPEAVKLAMKMLVQDLEKQGIIYADIRFAPQLFSKELRNTLGEQLTEEENSQLMEYEYNIVEEALKGIETAKLENMEANIILCCMRNKNWGSNERNNELANQRTVTIAGVFEEHFEKDLHNGRPIVTKIDLAGGENGSRNEDYEYIYEPYVNGKLKNVGLTIHSGEAGIFQEKLGNISNVINKTNGNIGHGVAIGKIYDDDILKPDKEQIVNVIKSIINSNRALEICITSNYQTKAVNKEHPVVKMLVGDKEQGIPALTNNITINTDNPTVSNTTLEKEFGEVIKLCKNRGLSDKETALLLWQLKENSIRQSRLSDKRKNKYLSEISKRREELQEEKII